MHPDVLDIPATAELLSLSERLTYRAVHAGEIPAWRLGSQWRLWRPAVLRAVGGDAIEDHPMHPADDPEVVDRKTVAKMLGITTKTCGTLLHDGTVPSTTIAGSTTRIYWPAVRQLMIEGSNGY